MRYLLLAGVVVLGGCKAPRGACSLVCDVYVKGEVTYEALSRVEQVVPSDR